jgi:hypothetical protein
MMRLMDLEGCIVNENRLEDSMDENLSTSKKSIDIKMLSRRIKIDKVINVEIFNQLLKQDCLFKVESKNHRLD